MSKPHIVELKEHISPKIANLIREKTEGNKIVLKGIFGQANVKNNNGRVYSREEMTDQATRLMAILNEGYTIMGELDHPDSITINLDRVSHKIIHLEMRGDNLIGKAELIPGTPCGDIAIALINSGCRLGLSTRGWGVEDPSGNITGFNLCTVDLVANPSAPEAYPNIVRESTSFNRRPLIETIHKDKASQKYIFEQFTKFIATAISK